jgi:photosystem I subunit V
VDTLSGKKKIGKKRSPLLERAKGYPRVRFPRAHVMTNTRLSLSLSFFMYVSMIHSKVKSQTRSTTRGAKVQTKAFSDVNLAISGANAMMLALGRFVFMPYQRAQIEKAGLPTQNGDTHFAAGDVKAEEASFLNTTNDPAGFTLIDVMAWGSLGHALGFAALAVGSFSLL